MKKFIFKPRCVGKQHERLKLVKWMKMEGFNVVTISRKDLDK